MAQVPDLQEGQQRAAALHPQGSGHGDGHLHAQQVPTHVRSMYP